jgi:NAD(P)-dependent dehydrogenase (short-subunit alcohol dehydrogenase family)
LGRATANAFAGRGDSVARVDFAPAPADGDDRFFDLAGIDLTDPAACAVVAGHVTAHVGEIDVLVNVAGGFVWQTLAEGEAENWQRMFAMNVLTASTMSRAALPALLKSPNGRIVNIGAGAALQAAAGMGAYAASKAGVHRLTESLAAELAGTSVTVNAVLPSIIDTPTNREDMPKADFGKWVAPEAIAEVILFLCSPAARAVNGALVPATRGTAG